MIKTIKLNTSQLMNVEHGLTRFHSHLMDKLREIESTNPMREVLTKAFKEKLNEVREQIIECKKAINE